MFEQATLSDGPTSKRVYSAFAGITSQLLLVTGVVLAPILFPQVLPKVPSSVPTVWTVGRHSKPPDAKSSAPHVTSVKPVVYREGVIFAPLHPPNKVLRIDDSELEAATGAPPGLVGGIGDGPATGMAGILPTAGFAVPPPRVVVSEPAKPATPVLRVDPVRVPIGGDVKPAQIVKRVEPIYPPIAKSARISGTVELEGVIGADGRMIELRVKSGHPFLAKAAYDAVLQWIYRPTTLNGKPVEVIAPITVTFRLN
jgi:protein TonB